ncbi:uncharacterized protein LOC123306260 [Coccinella septempunctata]|uniref:uncharacterized protein LOC123306260 n=1 Tax=Coccinella septempunctata TaxID=41139 RepID=UPI001D06128F|nr:uncharacterized protein LOC123306260 [Coccinella septempunctata]
MPQLSLFVPLLLTCIVTNTQALNNCKCWKDFEVVTNPFGDVFCQDKKNRTFNCNEEEPPLCLCTHKGKTVILDLGESNCQSIDPTRGSWCENREDWVAYFDRHPEFLMLD